jgi:hypothetical protein
MKLAFELADRADFLLSGTYSHTNSSSGQFVPAGANAFGYATQKAAIGAATICRCVPTINTNEAAIDLYKTWNVSGTLNWSITYKLSFISITSFTRFNELLQVSEDLTPFSVIAGTSAPTPIAYAICSLRRALRILQWAGLCYWSMAARLAAASLETGGAL